MRTLAGRPLPDVEQEAAALLDRAGCSAAPVNLGAIIEIWPDVEVSLDPLDTEGFLIDLGVHGRQLMLKQSDPQVRRRFTAAHEVGHLVLENHGIPLGTDHEPDIELWCDRFAAALMLPKAWIEDEMADSESTQLCDLLLDIPHRYKVSRETAWVRIAGMIGGLIILVLRRADGSAAVLKRYGKESTGSQAALRAFIRHRDRLTSLRSSSVLDDQTAFLLLSRSMERKEGAVRYLVVVAPASRPAPEAR